MILGTHVGGRPDAYPVQYKVLRLKDGAVLTLADALGRTAEVALSAGDARLLALGLLGALPAQSVSGEFGNAPTEPAP